MDRKVPKPYPTAENEEERNESLRSYQIMDSVPDTAFDEINNIAAQICECPVAYISFIEDDRFWFKSKYGLPDDFKGCPREIAFCSVTVCGFEIVISNDLAADDTFKDFHFVVNDPHFRFYCSMPLVTPDGYSIGTICVMDFEPRTLTHEKQEGLRRLAQQTMAQLEYRRRIIELDETVRQLDDAHRALAREKARGDRLLTTILPEEIAREMIENEKVVPRYFPTATVLFADVKGFTSFTGNAEPATLIGLLDTYFAQFDDIMAKLGVEKIKTIGDAYLAVAGVPTSDRLHTLNACLAALEMQAVVATINAGRQKLRLPSFQFRMGLHTGAVIAGVVGRHRFTYDIWGNAANVAARLESHCDPDRINVSDAIYNKMLPYFDFTPQGSVEVKNKGPINMYYLDRIRPEYAQDTQGFTPNRKLFEKCNPTLGQ
ncbi:MAG: adenylate/guanylate cyclase domain-containing protein [Hyphomicrobiaceae bacterium]